MKLLGFQISYVYDNTSYLLLKLVTLPTTNSIYVKVKTHKKS